MRFSCRIRRAQGRAGARSRVAAPWGALLLSLSIIVGCAVNPVTGQREVVLLSAAQEAELGRTSAERFSRELGLVEEPRIAGYVASVGERLAAHSPRRDVRYHFAITDTPEPNAFALPGGYVYVSRGALVIMNSEAELAGVLGHEVGHVAARHSVQQQTRSVGVGLLTVLGVVAAGAAGGEGAAQSVAQLGQVAGAGLIATYGRDQERQADEVGQALAAKDGYDPSGIAGFLRTLGRETTRLAAGRSREPSFFDSHPMTEERVQSALARADALPRGPGQPIAANRRSFTSRLEGLLIGPDPAGGLFRDQLFLHPSFGFALEFPSGWRTQNGRDAVLGVAADGKQALRLDGGAAGVEPAQAAAAFARENRITLQNARSLEIGGLPAYRAHALVPAQSGNVAMHLTWIGHRKGTFRLTGIAPEVSATAAFRRFDGVAGSFRPLTRAEREGVTERRLQVVEARAGETLAALGRRSKNAWSPEETAIANGLPDAAAALRAGDVIKIAVERPYTPPR